ncbi:MAG: glycerol-3-phosphate 1-O-acyltransferase PlsY [Candidatus Solibacter sp.]
MIPLAAVSIAYLLGAIPFGYLLVKLKTGGDVRQAGSGNIGATNVMRTTGRAAGILTLLLDIAKGWAAVWIACELTGHDVLWGSIAAVTVMLGHAYPVFLGFKGGKAVASVVGAFLFLTPAALGAEAFIFVVIVAVTRHISAASIVAAATLPFAVFMVARAPLPAIVAALVAGSFVIYRHSSNIQRLRAGTESVFKF